MILLEREPFLQGLETAFAQSSAGSGRVALVYAEAGMGKTSLVKEFIRRRQNETRTLWGQCDPLFTPQPLGPLHDMAVQTGGKLQALLYSDADRTLIFSTVLVELQRCPTVAVFEDIHWADKATFDLLRYLARRISQTSVLIVLTYRDDELGPQHPLLSVLGDLVTLPAVLRFPLPPLSEKAVQTLVGARKLDAHALHHQTGGNPFFVTEVLASPAGRIPPTIRDAVLARTARLSPQGRAVLESAAVIGTRAEPWLLDAVTGGAAEAVEESLAAGVLLAVENELAFRHELARQTILETTSPQRKYELHRQVLDALKSSNTARNDLARLAHHAEAVGDRAAVREHAPSAARQAAAAGAHHEAATLYALVLRYSDDLSPAEHALLLERYAAECNLTARQLDAIRTWRQAFHLWKELGNLPEQGNTLASLAIILRNNGDNPEAEEACRSAIEILEKLPPGRELALAYRARATLRLANREYSEAIRWGEKAVALAERTGDKNILGMAHVAIGAAWMFLDDEHGCRYLDERLRVAREAGAELHIANILFYAGATAAELYLFHRAEAYLSEGIAYTSDRGLDIFDSYMRAWLAITLIHLGRWREAAELIPRLFQNQAFPVISRIPALVAAGLLQARSGRGSVSTALDEALELAKKTGTLQYLGLVYTVRAEDAWLSGDPARAFQEASAAYSLALEKKHPWFAGELAYWRWRAAGEVEIFDWMAKPYALQIAGDWQSAAAEWERLGCPYEQARALAEGDQEARLEALRVFTRLGAQNAADELREGLRASGVMNLPQKPRRSTRQNPFGLTARQIEILALLTEELSNQEIAAYLHISPKTADHHVTAVLARLGVHSREAAAAFARQHSISNKK